MSGTIVHVVHRYSYIQYGNKHVNVLACLGFVETISIFLNPITGNNYMCEIT